MNAVDTNVLVYFLDADEPTKQAHAIALLDKLAKDATPTVLPWQVAVEFLSFLRRRQNEGKITAADTRRNLTQMEAMFPIVLPSQPILAASLDLSARHSLSHWDSLLLAACIADGITTLYSEDLSDRTTYDSVTVVNPFA